MIEEHIHYREDCSNMELILILCLVLQVQNKQDEWDTFMELILNEVDYSRTMEEMLHESRKKDRKHYYMLEKRLFLK